MLHLNGVCRITKFFFTLINTRKGARGDAWTIDEVETSDIGLKNLKIEGRTRSYFGRPDRARDALELSVRAQPCSPPYTPIRTGTTEGQIRDIILTFCCVSFCCQ